MRASTPAGWVTDIELPSLRLVVLEGEEPGRDWISSEAMFLIGKGADCAVVLKDPQVSRAHAMLRVTPEGILLEDLQSTNGTFIRGVRTKEAFLAGEMTFTVGSTTLKVERSLRRIRAPASPRDGLQSMVGVAEPMRELFGLIEAVAPLGVPTVVTGPAGNGKDLVARALHDLSGRRGSLQVVDCRQEGSNDLEYQLFGTPYRRKDDSEPEPAFFLARGGTLVLDHLERLNRRVDSRLMRFIETREVDSPRTGKTERLDVRLVVVTRHDLEGLLSRKRISADLHHRLSVIRLHVPPLAIRRADIVPLAARFAQDMGCAMALDSSAQERLETHPWPDGVRELRQVIERTLSRPGVPARLGAADLAMDASPAAAADEVPIRPLDELERETILAALQRFQGNKVHTAQALGIGLSTLKRKLKEMEERSKDT